MKRTLAFAFALILCLAPTLTAVPVPRRDPEASTSLPRVVIDTNYGTIVVELYPDKAPVTVRNFLQYVDERHYDGMIFHRVIPQFMIQGGGYEPGLREKKTRPPIPNEAGNGLSNERGTLAAARAAAPDSATAQFYINAKDNAFLDRRNTPDKIGHAVFGQVVEGMQVVDQISQVKTAKQGVHQDVPVEDVVIRSARRLTK